VSADQKVWNAVQTLDCIIWTFQIIPLFWVDPVYRAEKKKFFCRQVSTEVSSGIVQFQELLYSHGAHLV